MTHCSRLFAAILASVGFACPAMAGDCSALQIRNAVELEPIAGHNLMVVPIILNGIEKKFLFDTGASINLITRPTVEELKIPEYRSNYRTSDLYGRDSETFVQIHDVFFGAGKASGIQFQVMSPLPGSNGKPPFDGILSTGIFARDDFELDFSSGRVNFFSTDHCDGRVVYWPHQVLAVVPFDRTGGQINLPITLDGHPLRAILDTGSTDTSMDIARARRKLDFSPDKQTPPDNLQDDLNNKIYFRRFSALSFEGVTVSNPLIIIRPQQFGGGKTDDTVLGSRAEHQDDDLNRLAPDMIIGMNLLRHLHIYVATREHKLYITEAGSGDPSLPKDAAASANGP